MTESDLAPKNAKTKNEERRTEIWKLTEVGTPQDFISRPHRRFYKCLTEATVRRLMPLCKMSVIDLAQDNPLGPWFMA
jgi:hypothetical protein